VRFCVFSLFCISNPQPFQQRSRVFPLFFRYAAVRL
jgi:hypothetical protein